MRPFLFHIGDTGVPSFFFMIMVGALVSTFFVSYMAKREGADQVVILDFGIIAVIASVIGSRLVHILVENPAYYWAHPIRVFYFWQGGFVSIGAFLGTLVGWLIYIRKRRLQTWRYLDLAILAAPIVIFCVRIGCLLVGCCYGKPTDFFIHLTFTDPASTAGYAHLNEPLHATQVYNMLNAILMGCVLYPTYRYRRFYGQVVATFCFYYGVSRFFIEFLRGDVDRGIWFGGMLSTAQIAMIGTIIAGLIIWRVQSRRDRLPERNAG